MPRVPSFLLTRLAAIPLISDISVAFATTKIPLWLHKGFWPMAHEARTDYSMLLGGIFLLLVGAGPWFVDRILERPANPSLGQRE